MAKNITMYKACLNDNCDGKHALIKCSVTDKYCMKCGQPLTHVCIRCGEPIKNDLQKICDRCRQKQKEEKKEAQQKIMDGAKDAAKVIPAVVVPAVKFVADKGGVKKVADAAKTAAKIVKK